MFRPLTFRLFVIRFLLFGVLATSLLRCSSPCSDCAPAATGAEFFPLKEGAFVEYEVQEQAFALGQAAVVRSYQWKELIAEKYQDITGQTAYRIVRFRRANDTQRWQADSTITLRLGIDQAVRNENGRDYVKMLFPVYEKATWNGNVYNNLGEDKYELKNVGKPFKVGTQSFERTATVIQQNDSTLVDQNRRIEVYAADVGLVYRESINLQFCSSSPACVGKGQVDFGLRQYVRFKRAGVE